MAEYIERARVIRVLDAYEYLKGRKGCGIFHAIMHIPAADVAPVVPGRWIMSMSSHALECSECGMRVYSAVNYCPICGAKMDGGNGNGTT